MLGADRVVGAVSAANSLVGTTAGHTAPAPPDPSPRPAESSLSLICRIATPEQRRTYLQSWQTELQQDNDELLAGLRTRDRAAAAARLHRLQNAFLVMGRSEAVTLCTRLREAIRSEQGIEPALAALQTELQATAAMLRERLAEVGSTRRGDATAHLRPV